MMLLTTLIDRNLFGASMAASPQPIPPPCRPFLLCHFGLFATVIATFFAVISTYPRCHLNLPPLSSRPSPAVISTARERSHAAIIRPRKGILGVMRFLASLRNDSGAVISSFALPGTTRFRPSGTVIAPFPHCRLALPPLSSRPQGEISCSHHPSQERHPRRHEISRFASK